MANTPRYFTKGIELRGETADLSNNIEGTLWQNSTSNRIKTYIGAAVREMITADQAQTLTNKTINASNNTISNLTTAMLAAGVLDTDLSSVSGADDTIPSAKATKAYVDAVSLLHDQASEISFAPTGAIVATDTQAAVAGVSVSVEAHKALTSGVHGVSGSVVGTTDSQTLTNKTLTAPIVNSPTGIVKADVGLGNVDNTSDASKNSASVTLTNKTIVATANTISAIADANIGAAAAIARTKLASGLANAVVFNDGSGVLSNATDLTVGTNALTLANTKHIETQAVTDSTTTGANASLAAFNAGAVRLTNVSLTSLANIPAGANGQELAITNRTGADIQVVDSSAANGTAANRIFTGTSAAITFSKDSALFLRYDSTSTRWQVVGGGGSGSGTASLSTIFQLTGAEAITDWSSGNNATFLGGGALAATFAKETSSPLHGNASYKLTQAGGSLNDYIASPAQAVDLRFRGQQTFLTFPYQYNGATSDIQIEVYDVTNSAVISASTDVVIGTNGATSSALVGIIMPLTCASIRVGFQVKVLNSGKILSFDDVQLGMGIGDFSSIKTTDFEGIEALTSTSTYGSTNTGVPVLNITSNTNTGILQVVSDSVNGTSFKALKDAVVTMTVSGTPASNGSTLYLTKNAATLTVGSPPTTFLAKQGMFSVSPFGSLSATVKVVTGDILRVQANDPNPIVAFTISAIGQSSAVVTPLQQISSDTMTFAFKSTAIVSTDPIGTFNTYTYAINTNTPTISGSAPTQTVTSMNTDGIQVFARAFNAASTTASPARVDVFIGKGLKSKQVDAYVSSAKAAMLNYDYMVKSTTSERGTNISYSEITGILMIDAGLNVSSGTTAKEMGIDVVNNNAPSSAYFVFNASKAPSLAAIPYVQPRIATLSEQQSSGTNGGTATPGSYVARVLNTKDDPTGIINSFSSNQFSLTAGQYYIEAAAPYFGTQGAKVKLRNTTDSTDAIVGRAMSLTTATGSENLLIGLITITATKTFELQQRVGNTQASNGYGVAQAYGEVEVYSQIKIEKVK